MHVLWLLDCNFWTLIEFFPFVSGCDIKCENSSQTYLTKINQKQLLNQNAYIKELSHINKVLMLCNLTLSYPILSCKHHWTFSCKNVLNCFFLIAQGCVCWCWYLYYGWSPQCCGCRCWPTFVWQVSLLKIYNASFCTSEFRTPYLLWIS